MYEEIDSSLEAAKRLIEKDSFEDFYAVQEYVKEKITGGKWYKCNDEVPTRPHYITKGEVIKLYCFIVSKCHYLYSYKDVFSVYPTTLAKKLNIELCKIKQGLGWLEQHQLITVRVNKNVTYHNNHPLIIHTTHFPF